MGNRATVLVAMAVLLAGCGSYDVDPEGDVGSESTEVDELGMSGGSNCTPNEQCHFGWRIPKATHYKRYLLPGPGQQSLLEQGTASNASIQTFVIDSTE